MERAAFLARPKKFLIFFTTPGFFHQAPFYYIYGVDGLFVDIKEATAQTLISGPDIDIKKAGVFCTKFQGFSGKLPGKISGISERFRPISFSVLPGQTGVRGGLYASGLVCGVEDW